MFLVVGCLLLPRVRLVVDGGWWTVGGRCLFHPVILRVFLSQKLITEAGELGYLAEQGDLFGNVLLVGVTLSQI